MAISQAMATSQKVALLTTLASHTLKMALYDSTASLGAATTAYITSGEVTGTGYVAGGATMTGAVATAIGTTAILDFDDVVWAASTITARGALIYDTSAANAAVAVLDFGADKSSTASDFTVIMPAAAASTALIRIA